MSLRHARWKIAIAIGKFVLAVTGSKLEEYNLSLKILFLINYFS